MGYQYHYNNEFPSVEPGIDSAMGSVFDFVIGFVLVFYLLLLAFGVVTYILQSLGFYKIAKRRGIRNPWLAWLPIGNMWILGSISDQYQYVAKGCVRNRRKVLTGLNVAMLAAATPMYISAIVSALAEAAAMDANETLFGATVGILLITYLVLVIISVIAVVLQYMSLYNLYVSCDPGNGVLYLVLSIFVSVTMPFFVFACRNKDGGMPPRKEAPREIPLVEAVVEAPADTTEG